MAIKVKYLGQCGFIFESEGVSIAIDPVLNDIIENGEDLRCYPPVIEPKELKVDFILCTHDHIDHMAISTITDCLLANPNTRVIVPKGCVKMLYEAGVSVINVIGVSEGEEVACAGGKLVVKGISAAHPVHQLDEDGYDRNLVYSIKMDGKNIVHFGDTYRTDRLMDGLRSFGKIDVAFMPINGRDEIRDAKGIIGNLNPVEAAEIASELNIKVSVPMHFDMIKGNTADPKEYVDALLRLNADSECIVPRFDEIVEL